MSTHRFCKHLYRVSIPLVIVALLLLDLNPHVGRAVVQAESIYFPLIMKPRPTGPGHILYSGLAASENLDSIFVISANGTGNARLTTGVDTSDPDWSPDGQKIVFAGSCGAQGGTNLCIINADGSGLVPLTEYDGTELHPAWSPDGTRIAFTSSLGGAWNLYTVNSDGANRVQLTDDSTSDSYPAWSPDGDKIAFQSFRDDAVNGIDLHVMDLATRTVTNLTDNGESNREPAWSPDGSTIAWCLFHHIYQMNADGTNQRSLVGTEGDEEYHMHPTWSPDGQWVAFEVERDHGTVIGVIRKDGSDYYEITQPAGVIFDYTDPDWGP